MQGVGTCRETALGNAPFVLPWALSQASQETLLARRRRACDPRWWGGSYGSILFDRARCGVTHRQRACRRAQPHVCDSSRGRRVACPFLRVREPSPWTISACRSCLLPLSPYTCEIRPCVAGSRLYVTPLRGAPLDKHPSALSVTLQRAVGCFRIGAFTDEAATRVLVHVVGGCACWGAGCQPEACDSFLSRTVTHGVALSCGLCLHSRRLVAPSCSPLSTPSTPSPGCGDQTCSQALADVPRGQSPAVEDRCSSTCCRRV